MAGKHGKEVLASRIQTVLAQVLLRDVQDPRLQNVQITGVELTADLGLARIYYRSWMPDADPKEMANGFKRAAGLLRSRIAKACKMRTTPELQFRYDTSIDQAGRIDSLLQEVRSELNEEEGNEDHES